MGEVGLTRCCGERRIHYVTMGPAAAFALAGAVLAGSPPSAATARLAELPVVRFERFDADNGLPQSSVYDLAEGSDGSLWFVTLDGLVRYDGARFETWNRGNSLGLGTSRLTALREMAPGMFWLGAEDGTLVQVAGGGLTSFAQKDEREAVTGLAAAADPRELIVFRRQSAQLVRLTGELPTGLRTVESIFGRAEYHCGPYLVAEAGLAVARQGRLELLAWPRDLDDPFSLRCQLDAGGELWLRAPDGRLWRTSEGRIAPSGLGSRLPLGALPIAEDADGSVWLSLPTPPHLWRLDAAGGLHPYGPALGVEANAVPMRAFRDRDGQLWLGTSMGLYRHLGEAISGLALEINGQPFAIRAHTVMRDGTVWAFTDDGRLLEVTPGGALRETMHPDREGRPRLRRDRLRAADGAPWQGQAPALAAVSAFLEDRGGALWVGTDVGLLILRSGTIELIGAGGRGSGGVSVPGGVNDLLEASDGSVWLAGSKGIARFADRQWRESWLVGEELATGATDLLQDHTGVIWAATQSGVLRYAGGAFHRVPGLGPEIGVARALAEDARGQIWVGTSDQGLYRRLTDGTVQHVGVAQGLPTAGAFTLVLDPRGWLWTTSNRGLARLSLAGLDDAFFGRPFELRSAVYGRADGLPTGECNGGFAAAAYLCGEGSWCFQTLVGIARARLDQLTNVDSPPAARIASVDVDGLALPVDQPISMAAHRSRLAVAYGGVSLRRWDRVSYRYRLSGLDEDWIEAGDGRRTHYARLPPGRYRFEVAARTGDGTVGPVASLPIWVEAAWWQRPWLWVAMLVGSLGLLGRRALARAPAARLGSDQRPGPELGQAAAVTVAPAPEAGGEAAPGAGVLVVEDDPVSALVVVALLRRRGYRVASVADGRAALAALRAEAWHSVLMDLHLPDMSGVETARLIRAERTLSQPRIFALTATATADDREQCRLAGMDGFLSKPVREPELLDALRGLAAGGRPGFEES